MIRYLVARFTLLTVAAAACAKAPETPPPDAAARNVTQARALAEDLANSTQNYQPVRFVSAIEQVRVPKPVTRIKPDTVVVEGKEALHVEAVPVPIVAPEAELPAVQVDSTTESVSEPRVPSIIPRDAPEPAAVGGAGGEWRGRDPGPDQGNVIGVVLRGGRVDPGHCPRHRPPSPIPNRIPQR